MKQNEEQNWLQRVTGSLYGLTLSERQLRNRRRGRYIFTDKKHPWRGVFATIAGICALGSLFLSVTMTYYSGGEATGNYAVGVILALVFAVTGLVMAVMASGERDIYHLFPRMAAVMNVLVILCVAGILFLGLR